MPSYDDVDCSASSGKTEEFPGHWIPDTWGRPPVLPENFCISTHCLDLIAEFFQGLHERWMARGCGYIFYNALSFAESLWEMGSIYDGRILRADFTFGHAWLAAHVSFELAEEFKRVLREPYRQLKLLDDLQEKQRRLTDSEFRLMSGEISFQIDEVGKALAQAVNFSERWALILRMMGKAPEKSTITSPKGKARVSQAKLDQAISYIQKSGPLKGTLIARHLNVEEDTFHSNYVPALKLRGVKNDRDGDGYYFDSTAGEDGYQWPEVEVA